MLRVGIICCPVGVPTANHAVMHTFMGRTVYTNGVGVKFCSVHIHRFPKTSTENRQKLDTPLFFCSLRNINLTSPILWVSCGHVVQDLQRICFLLLTTIFFGLLHAQENQYEQMKSQLNDNSLPLVNLTVDISSVNRSNYVQGEIEITDYLRRTDPATETVHYQCKLRYRGASSSGYNKKSFAVKLYDEAGEDLDANVFGIREENSWILDAMAIDRTRMRNRVCFDVWNDMSQTPYETNFDNRNGTKGVFVEVFLNGEYHGLYCMTDKIDRKLLGLKKAKVGDDGDVTVKGLLYKGISWGSGYNLLSYDSNANVDQDTWNSWELQYPDDYPSIDTWQPLMNLIDFCSDETTDEEFEALFNDYFYTDNFADYVVFTLALNVGDNIYKNTFLSVVDITKGHRYMISPWDMDMSLGGNWDGTYNERLSSINQYNGRAPFNRLIKKNMDGFVSKLTDIWTEYYTTMFAPENIGQRLDNYANMFEASGAWERELGKWNENPVPLKTNIAEEMNYVKGWYVRNYESLCNQFGTPPVTNAIANIREPVFLDNIYTLDGRKINATDTRQLTKGIYIVHGRKVLVR